MKKVNMQESLFGAKTTLPKKTREALIDEYLANADKLGCPLVELDTIGRYRWQRDDGIDKLKIKKDVVSAYGVTFISAISGERLAGWIDEHFEMEK